MSLQACRGEVRRMMGRARPRPTTSPQRGGLGRLATQIRGLEIASHLSAIRDQLVRDLLEIDGNEQPDLEECARNAIAACRRFHESVWDAIAVQRQALLADAAEELEPLRTLLRGSAWDAAVEEVARDRVRARFPLISAQIVWDRLHEEPMPTTP